ncbi:hypothetical protein BJX76DRAFT_65965 [Aspergillus varians]
MPGTYVESNPEYGWLPFDPSSAQRHNTPLLNENFTPRYLYRLVAPQAGGSAAAARMSTAIPMNNTDIYHLPTQKGAAQLLNHLLWQQGHQNGCNLMSWTSSLLFALQFALYRHSKDGDDLRQIQLIILDTSCFPPGTFIQDMEIMRSFQDADHRIRKFVEFRESEYYFGEYLTQGRLAIQGKCVCTSVQRLIDLGLFELQPALADREQWQWWPKRVLEFREEFLAAKYMPTTDEDVETAVDIAVQCFGGRWMVPVAIMLLALQPRRRNDKVIIQRFKAQFSMRDVSRAGLYGMKVDSRRLPEVGQFKELVEAIQRAYAPSDYDDLVGTVEGLTV